VSALGAGPPEAEAGDVMVDVDGLRVRLAGSTVDVVDDVSFQVRSGELMGLVGESGSGKTTVALALLGHTRRGLEVAGGTVLVRGTDMVTASKQQLRRLRGAEVAYVPQDPAAALNPALRIGTQLIEVLHAHPEAVAAKGLGDPRARVAQTLEEAGLGGVPGLLKTYPHQLSGGQQQRVALAMAFALRPSVIVLDEPTTGLDVQSRRRLWDVVREASGNRSILFTTHYLEEAQVLASRILVVDRGRLLFDGDAQTLRELVGNRRVTYVGPDGPVVAMPGDTDAYVRELVTSGASFSNLEIAKPSLEEAFLLLTKGPA
jgi:peptide/nickel transport system ATP-binding protein